MPVLAWDFYFTIRHANPEMAATWLIRQHPIGCCEALSVSVVTNHRWVLERDRRLAVIRPPSADRLILSAANHPNVKIGVAYAIKRSVNGIIDPNRVVSEDTPSYTRQEDSR